MDKNRLDKPEYEKNNFSLLRLLASYFVLISHSFAVLDRPLDQPALWYNGKNIIFSGVGLSIFFTISGFLVTQSLLNSNSIKHYLWKRLVRIFPALIAANLFCIVGGSFLTSLPMTKYLFSPDTWMYLLKNSTLVVNQFYLPGVFNELKDHTVNASLWTLLVEVECYVVLALGAYVIVIRKWLYLACFVFFEALRVYMTVFNNIQIKGIDLYSIFSFGTYFYLGSLLFCFKEDIRFKWFYANILMAVALATVYTFLEPITLSIFFAYCFIIIGNSKTIINLKGFDLSYGVYLYAFPVQQTLVLWMGYEINVWLHISFSAVLTTILAFLSWSLVEKPFLRKKNRRYFD